MPDKEDLSWAAALTDHPPGPCGACPGDGPIDKRPWPWIHHHDGFQHTHMCSFDDAHAHTGGHGRAQFYPWWVPAEFELVDGD